MQWSLLSISASDWLYRNEGGSSLVFAQRQQQQQAPGDGSSLTHAQHVLKLSKAALLSVHRCSASAAALMESQQRQTARRLTHSRLLLRLLGAERRAGAAGGGGGREEGSGSEAADRETSGGVDAGRPVWLLLSAACDLLQQAERCRPRSAAPALLSTAQQPPPPRLLTGGLTLGDASDLHVSTVCCSGRLMSFPTLSLPAASSSSSSPLLVAAVLQRDVTDGRQHCGWPWWHVPSSPVSLTVELKPKWGFLPSSPFLSPHSAAVKQRVCRFCMHQQLKRSRGEGSEHNSGAPPVRRQKLTDCHC
jgi:hypothetical protein